MPNVIQLNQHRFKNQPVTDDLLSSLAKVLLQECRVIEERKKKMKDLIHQVKQLRDDFPIARILIMEGRYIRDVGEFEIETAFIKTGNFASHIRKFLQRSSFPNCTYEVHGVEPCRYWQGD